MNFDQFFEQCMKTAIKNKNTNNMLYASNALCGESGELANYVKKVIRDNKNFDNEILLEIFDIWWYTMYLLDIMGYTPELVIVKGFDKLQKRKGVTNIG